MEERFVIAVLLALSVALSHPGAATARGFEGDFENEEPSEINTSFGIEGWFSMASAKWQISFPYTTQAANGGIPAGTTGRGQSELDFKKIDSPLAVFTGGAKISDSFSFDMVYGVGSLSGGRGTDTDRFAGGGTTYRFSESTSDLSGDVKMWGGNLYFRKNRYGEGRRTWGALIGFLHYEDNLRITNGVQTVSQPFETITFPPIGSFSGLNSTYDFTWDLLRVGALHQVPITKSLSYTGTYAAIPLLRYEGDGYWNLRAGPGGFRVQSPNFIQKSSTGYGLDLSVGLRYEVSENFELSAGYRCFYLYAKNGTDTTYFADGSTQSTTLDWVTVTRQGGYAGMLVKF